MVVIKLQIFMKIIILAISVLLFILVFKTKEKYKLVLNKYFWLFASWMICLLLYFFSGIKYTFNLTLISFGYILLTLFLFVTGNFVSKKLNINFINNFKINEYNKKINFFPLFIASLISTIFYVVYILINNDIKFGFTRNVGTNAVTTILLFISASSLIIWLYELAYSLFNDKGISWYGLFSAVLFNIPGLVISGRDALIIFLITTFIVFIYCGNYAIKKLKQSGKIFKRILICSILILVIILIYLIFLSNNRYGENKNAALDMFEWSAGCEFPDYLENFNEKVPSVGDFINNIIFYYSSQISKFAFIFDNYKGPYLYGFYQLHYISRRLPESWGIQYSVVGEQLKELTTNAGVPGIRVMWETALGYSIYDFGRLGTLIVSILGGIIVGLISKIVNKKNTIFSILVRTFLCLAMFLTVQLSPLFDYFYIFPLVWLSIIIFVSYRKKQNEEI